MDHGELDVFKTSDLLNNTGMSNHLDELHSALHMGMWVVTAPKPIANGARVFALIRRDPDDELAQYGPYITTFLRLPDAIPAGTVKQIAEKCLSIHGLSTKNTHKAYMIAGLQLGLLWTEFFIVDPGKSLPQLAANAMTAGLLAQTSAPQLT